MTLIEHESIAIEVDEDDKKRYLDLLLLADGRGRMMPALEKRCSRAVRQRDPRILH